MTSTAGEHRQRKLGVWRVRNDRVIDLRRPVLIGIVNATPDSFSDGGSFRCVDALIGHSLRLIEEGATIIDVGGESTRPGAVRVDADEQIRRTAALIGRLRATTDIPISIDTTLAAVAAAALDAGADIINDVAAGLEDDEMVPLAAERGAGMILMHRLRPPTADSFSHEYKKEPEYLDVVSAVAAFLRERAGAVEAAGIDRARIALDPGLGFGKSVHQNYELIARAAELVGLGYPVVSGASRKSFLGAVTGVAEPHRRIIASTAVSVAHYLAGVRLFRVHDVAAHREALAVAQAITAAQGEQAPA